VDIAIIRGIDADPDKQQFLKALIEYARPRGVQVLAEGVETMDDLRRVLEMGVDLLQGYCLARPAAGHPAIPVRVGRVIPQRQGHCHQRKGARGSGAARLIKNVMVLSSGLSGHD